MDNKKNAEVLIDGKIYSLSSGEDQQYLQKIAGYITEKTVQLKRQEGFSKQSQEYQAVMVEFNIADDYFRALDKAAASDRKRDHMERDSYSLKHELVTVQMSLERTEKELAEAKQELASVTEELKNVKAALEEEKRRQKPDRDELLRLRALQATYNRGGIK